MNLFLQTNTSDDLRKIASSTRHEPIWLHPDVNVAVFDVPETDQNRLIRDLGECAQFAVYTEQPF